MKLLDFFDGRKGDVLIGIVLGVTLGMHYTLDAYKVLFVVLSVIGGLKLAIK